VFNNFLDYGIEIPIKLFISISLFSFSMVSLDGLQKFLKTVPNNYKYLITKELTPTKYQSVLPAKFVFLD